MPVVCAGFLLLGIAIAAPPSLVDVAADISIAERAHDILVSRCLRCHGGVREQGGLNLAWRDRALRARTKGPPAIIPGDAAASALLMRVTHADPELRMPAEGNALSADEISTLRAWIDAGAVYPVLWSLRPIAKEMPAAGPDSSWNTNGIDRAVSIRLASAGIPLPPEATPEAIIRRAALDITGLPPDPALASAYVSDPCAASWERTVDGLLASPAFGERWARVWLDIARYADTKGYEKDARRDVWRFRDWLIDAWNTDMPYDQFTQRVLAGDLLPGATENDRIATTFHRLTLTNDEGGTDNEEFRVAAVMDRSVTTWLAWMGTSMQCVQCHAHPYDTIDHRDYYTALAYFNQTADADRDDDSPSLQVAWERGKTTVPVMQELPLSEQRATYVFTRGNWRALGEAVTPSSPACFPMVGAQHHDRLGLAKWIMDPMNPRTARVEANRIWETIFGRGLVETLEDFGEAGARPSDSVLLDVLASRLQELGWSRKALIREIMNSRTYRMSAHPSEAALRLDPDNRLMSRAPHFRLEAETIRDQSLAVAGILDRTMHGPPVFPYQPDGTWMVVYSGDGWTTSEGGDRFRRAIYTFWRRSSPHPSLMTFDAVSRETCTVRRVRTNTPLAALAAMNDPTFVEASKAFAQRAIDATPGASDTERARWMLSAALIRAPRNEECARLAQLVAGERAATASATSTSNELAAWSAAAATVMNLDEFLSRT